MSPGQHTVSKATKGLPEFDRVLQAGKLCRDPDRARHRTAGERQNGARIEFLTSLLSETAMLAKRTSKNQVTLPKAVVQMVGEADYYDVTAQNGKIVLTPIRLQQADAVRAKLDELGITEDDVGEAIAWARKRA